MPVSPQRRFQIPRERIDILGLRVPRAHEAAAAGADEAVEEPVFREERLLLMFFRTMTRKRGLFYLLMLVLITPFALLVPNGYSRQQARIRLAAEHAEKLTPLISGDSAFSRVKYGSYTGEDGSVIIHGEVADEATFRRLRSIVESSNPPVTVVYRLQSETDIFRDIIKRP